MPYLKNTADQVMRGALLKASGERYTNVTGFTVRVGIDNAAAVAGTGTLLLDGTSGFVYTFNQTETVGDFGTLQVDHQDASMPWTANVSWQDDLQVQIASLNNISSSQSQVAAAAALVNYDPPTSAEATADTDAILAAVGGVNVPALLPVSQIPVPSGRTITLTPSSSGLVGEEPLGLNVGEEKLVGIDFRKDMPTNGRFDSFVSVDIVSGNALGMSFDPADIGFDSNLLKVVPVGAIAGEYTVRFAVTYYPDSATAEADVDFVVNA